ncbi:glycosyltransferase family 25 protein [Acetobacter cibinongensis]|uniref:Glycosyl transferase family 25 domain-containing protein n=1 Tax=Acetobacter cibinongensis TaxID=146475 RepID=A0A1Z5YWE0_9PROT|nr:glycosyltransferase family 25 protein [Acetobacter cibinongensis]OUJ03306.1 hypothetical protein HK14_02475 [Acetobacter cibinongensis]
MEKPSVSNYIRVISLDRTPERFENFSEKNSNLLVQRFPAYEGSRISRASLIERGIIDANLKYTNGALGCAISHVSLWHECVNRNEILHIAEDDAIIRDDFHEIFQKAQEEQEDWDIFLWGYNINWPIGIKIGLDKNFYIKAQKDSYQPEQYKTFQSTREKIFFLPISSVAGLGFYTISPKGADKMLRRSLPLRGILAPYAEDENISWDNTGIDVELSRHYGALNAFISFPPTAIMINDETNSTIRGTKSLD